MQGRYFTLCEQAALALSLLAIGFLLIDPFMLERARTLSHGARAFFHAVTDLGRSHWMLVPTAAVIVFAIVMRRRHLGFRNAAGYGLIVSMAGFAFVSIAGSRRGAGCSITRQKEAIACGGPGPRPGSAGLRRCDGRKSTRRRRGLRLSGRAGGRPWQGGFAGLETAAAACLRFTNSRRIPI